MMIDDKGKEYIKICMYYNYHMKIKNRRKRIINYIDFENLKNIIC